MAFNRINRADEERFVALNFYGDSPDSNAKTIINNNGDKETESIDCFRYRIYNVGGDNGKRGETVSRSRFILCFGSYD